MKHNNMIQCVYIIVRYRSIVIVLPAAGGGGVAAVVAIVAVTIVVPILKGR